MTTVDIRTPFAQDSAVCGHLIRIQWVEGLIRNNARRPDPTIASLAYVAISHRTDAVIPGAIGRQARTIISAISPHSAARRILEAR